MLIFQCIQRQMLNDIVTVRVHTRDTHVTLKNKLIYGDQSRVKA